jgi:hypothetical protein
MTSLDLATFSATLATQNFRPRVPVIGNGRDNSHPRAAAALAGVGIGREGFPEKLADANHHQHGNLPSGEAISIPRN